ncbi:aldehyde dehydrogenase family protein [Spirillospora sp. NPDC046719]
MTTVHEAGAEVVGAAAAAARAALAGPWGTSSAAYRADLLRRIADRIEARSQDLLDAEIADTGKPAALARELDISRAARNFRVFADTIAAGGLDSYLTETADGGRALNYAVPKPLGVVAVIVPWNSANMSGIDFRGNDEQVYGVDPAKEYPKLWHAS